MQISCTGRGCAIEDCTASDNTGIGITTANSRITGCTITSNGGEGATVSSNCTVDDCYLWNNTGGGVTAGTRCRITGNEITANGDATTFPNLLVTSKGCFIADNSVRGESRIGIRVTNTGNVVIRNAAARQTTPYDIVANNTVGPIVDDSTIATNTNPHANYRDRRPAPLRRSPFSTSRRRLPASLETIGRCHRTPRLRIA